MAEVFFYHLTQTPLEVTLPELLEKSRTSGWKALVKCGTAARMHWLDERLWTGQDAGFLPHAVSGGAYDADQPILLTLDESAANGAQILMVVDGAAVSADEVARFQRVCVVFDGNDAAALDFARGQWKLLTDAGCPAKYWSQETGSWAQKASKNL